MRKILLGAFALFAAVAVNAQEFGTADSQDFQDVLDMGGATDGCVLHEGENVTWGVGSDTWKSGGCSFRFIINDDESTIYKTDGATGSNNPVLSDDQGPVDEEGIRTAAQGAPTSGAYFTFDVKTDGYIYVLAKINTNKRYFVFEEGIRLPYYWGAYDSSYGLLSYNFYDMPDMLEYDATVDGYYIANEALIDYPHVYLSAAGQVPESYTTDITGCVIKFQVFAGCQYIFCGGGTKCAVGGYYFDTTGDSKISMVEVSDDDSSVVTASYVLCDETSVVGVAGETGISNVTVAPTTANGAIYNVLGQRMSTMSKGINIVNGQKILIK